MPIRRFDVPVVSNGSTLGAGPQYMLSYTWPNAKGWRQESVAGSLMRINADSDVGQAATNCSDLATKVGVTEIV